MQPERPIKPSMIVSWQNKTSQKLNVRKKKKRYEKRAEKMGGKRVKYAKHWQNEIMNYHFINN